MSKTTKKQCTSESNTPITEIQISEALQNIKDDISDIENIEDLYELDKIYDSFKKIAGNFNQVISHEYNQYTQEKSKSEEKFHLDKQNYFLKILDVYKELEKAFQKKLNAIGNTSQSSCEWIIEHNISDHRSLLSRGSEQHMEDYRAAYTHWVNLSTLLDKIKHLELNINEHLIKKTKLNILENKGEDLKTWSRLINLSAKKIKTVNDTIENIKKMESTINRDDELINSLKAVHNILNSEKDGGSTSTQEEKKTDKYDLENLKLDPKKLMDASRSTYLTSTELNSLIKCLDNSSILLSKLHGELADSNKQPSESRFRASINRFLRMPLFNVQSTNNNDKSNGDTKPNGGVKPEDDTKLKGEPSPPKWKKIEKTSLFSNTKKPSIIMGSKTQRINQKKDPVEYAITYQSKL